MFNVGDTARLMCPVSGALRGLVRVKRGPDGPFHGVFGGPYTVWAETPILDWLSTGESNEYPHRMPYEVGHVFNVEFHELMRTGQ